MQSKQSEYREGDVLMAIADTEHYEAGTFVIFMEDAIDETNLMLVAGVNDMVCNYDEDVQEFVSYEMDVELVPTEAFIKPYTDEPAETPNNILTETILQFCLVVGEEAYNTLHPDYHFEGLTSEDFQDRRSFLNARF